MRVRALPCAILFAVLAVLPTKADELDDLKSTIRKKAYGDHWDRLDALSKLGTIGTPKAAEAVAEVMADDDAPIREAAAKSLARMSEDATAFVVSRLLTHGSPVVRATAVWALALGNRKTAVKPLEGLVAKAGETPEVRIAAARALGKIGERSASETLATQAAGNAPPAVRAECLLAIAALGGGNADLVAKALANTHANVRAAALVAAAADGTTHAERVKQALADKETTVRVAAVDALFPTLAAAALEPAAQALGDKAWPVRVAAINALVEVWTKEAVDALVRRMQEEKARLRFDIAMALTEMTGKDIGYDPLAWKGWWEGNRDKFELDKKPKNRKAREEKAREAKEGDTVATFFNIPILSDRVAFVLDFSGSMKTLEDRPTDKGETATQGSDNVMKLDLAVQEFDRCLTRLDPKVKFNVFLMCYARDPLVLERTAFNKTLAQALPANLKNASRFVDESRKAVVAVKRGRGDMYDQVLAAFADEEVDTVIVLSDGRPSWGLHVDEDDFHYFLGHENRWRKVMIHAVLTGTRGTDIRFMEKLAGDTGGLFTRK